MIFLIWNIYFKIISPAEVSLRELKQARLI